MSNNSSYKNLLASINELNNKESLGVFVPSTGNEVQFSPLTVKQQKLLLSSSVDTDFENLSFMNAVNNIITTNCKQNIRILTTDKPLIILQLRQQAIGDKLKIVEGDNTYEINLPDHINACKLLDASTPDNLEIEHDIIKIICSIPDITTDTKYNKQFTKKVQKPKSKEKLKVTDIIGDIYVSELVKYIYSINIGEDTVTPGVDVNISDMIDVFESLPMQVSNKLAALVKDTRSFEISCLTPESLPEGVSISIDAGLFTAE